MKGIKCPLKKDYVKVEGEDSDSDSSEGKSDHLSYSYSCVKSFNKNQHIIGGLAALHNQQKFQGTSHQPALYSLSGERSRPICQPFYCTTVAERSDSSEEGHDCSQEPMKRNAVRITEKEKHTTTSSASQHQFPVKDILIQWLKHQYKQVNSLWSSNITKGTFIPKFRKKNKKMKMEMTLNGVDEETKNRLIDYINRFDLGFEEHRNLCTGNETVFEIDVTSILDDPHRLQSFLAYIKNIESGKSKILSSRVSPRLNGYVDNHKIRETHTQEKICKKDQKQETRNYRKPIMSGKNTYKTYSESSSSSEIEDNPVVKRNKCPLKQEKINQIQKFKNQIYEGEVKIVPEVKIENSETKRDSDNQIWKRETLYKKILPECEKGKSEEKFQGKKRVRKISTLSGAKDSKGYTCDKLKANFEQNNEFLSPRKVNFEQNVFNVQTNKSISTNETAQFQNEVHREISCKCLMHHNREDVYRYKNQCLFGKGDEINNSFIKYVNQRETKSNLSLHLHENQLNDLPDEICENKNVEVTSIDERPANEKYLQKASKENVPYILKSESIKPTKYLDYHKGVPLKTVEKNQFIDAHKETLCLKVDSFADDDDDGGDDAFIKGNDLKVIATNACFESLSYCVESFQKINTSHELSMTRDMQENNKCSLSNEDKNGHEGFINILQESSFKSTALHSSVSPDSRSTPKHCTRSSNLYKANLVTRTGVEKGPKVCICNDNHSINRRVVLDDNKLHSSLSNTIKFDKCKNDSSSQKIDNSNCCILGCDCNKHMKHKSKIKTIVFKIGTSNKELKIGSVPSSQKKKSKLKSLKPKEVCREISLFFIGNGCIQNEEGPFRTSNNEETNKTICFPSVSDKPLTKKTDNNSSSCVHCEGNNSFINSPACRSKGATLTPNLLNLESSSIFENNLRVLVSELKSQRTEIDYLKTLLGNQTTHKTP